MRTRDLLLIYMYLFQVIEAEALPGDLCTRREYAQWLVAASSALSRYICLLVTPMYGSV